VRMRRGPSAHVRALRFTGAGDHRHATALDYIVQLRSALATAGWVAPRTQSEHRTQVSPKTLRLPGA